MGFPFEGLKDEAEKNTIMLTLVYQGKEYQVQTRRDQYYSLMTLISDHLSILEFGLCCGMGSCGTCGVEIKDKHSSIIQFALSCDVQVNDALANSIITVAAKE
jgi:succinate dehydrogenase/fumarate reductase-like Fe-S protein